MPLRNRRNTTSNSSQNNALAKCAERTWVWDCLLGHFPIRPRAKTFDLPLVVVDIPQESDW